MIAPFRDRVQNHETIGGARVGWPSEEAAHSTFAILAHTKTIEDHGTERGRERRQEPGMSRSSVRIILLLIVTVSSFLSLASPTAVNTGSVFAQAQAPYGIGGVTTSDLTPEQFAAALPEEFGGAAREYVGFVPVEEQVHAFSTTSEEFIYSDATSEMNVWVVINDIGAELTVQSAIESIAEGRSVRDIEQQGTTSSAGVPYLLANEDESFFALVWGAREGDWVFSVFASSAVLREEFTRTLVDSLAALSSSHDQVSGQTPSAASQPSPTQPPQQSGMDAEALAERLLTSPFLTSELPPGGQVTAVSSTEAGQTDGPMFGTLPVDLGATWLNVEITLPPITADVLTQSTYMQFAVFPSEAAAEHAYHSEEVFGYLQGRGQGLTFIDQGEEYPIAAVLWARSDVSPPSTSGRARLGRETVSAGTVARSGNVLVVTDVLMSRPMGTADDVRLDPGLAPVVAFDLTVGAVEHVKRLGDASSQQSGPVSSDVGATDANPGVTFTPQQLNVQLEETVSVEVVMPTTDFGGQYNLDILIPPQLQLVSLPQCVSDAESCVNFAPAIVPQLDGSTLVAISGYYGLSEPGLFALDLDVVDVPQADGPRVGISAQLVFYTSQVEYDPIDAWLEVDFE